MSTKYVVLDRDGTLIKHIPYLHNPDLVEILPGVKDSLALLINNDCKLFLHTNQSGVSRGYFNIQDVVYCNNRLVELLKFDFNLFDEICIAPDFPADNNSYRKPSPKFGFEIIKKYAINKNQLYYLGDSFSDLQTAYNIGCNAIGVNTGLVNLWDHSHLFENGTLIFNNILEAVNFIIADNEK